MKEKRKRLQELNLRIGKYTRGEKNAITDVPGVLVGHTTLIEGQGALEVGKGPIRTGVTVILPHSGNIYQEKVLASSFVMNGYGKTIGLVQINELGTIETPIALTNTLNAPIVADALIDYSVKHNPEIGISLASVNPVVGECNDGFLNDIQGRHVTKEHVFEAIEKASSFVEEGCVGAGTGMRALGFKGGIGTSSRIIKGKEKEYTVGVLVVSNFGRKEDLRFLGIRYEEYSDEKQSEDERSDAGSIMVIIATNAPLTSRQLNRICKRAPLGIARTGGFASHGSGDIIIAFSTANLIKLDREIESSSISMLNENNPIFSDLLSATVDATEEAILNSLLMAVPIDGRDGHHIDAIDIKRIE
ncbi:MAG: DmpA family aminopeptidase [Candidatus Heimdallarchaeaceae archaeon]